MLKSRLLLLARSKDSGMQQSEMTRVNPSRLEFVRADSSRVQFLKIFENSQASRPELERADSARPNFKDLRKRADPNCNEPTLPEWGFPNQRRRADLSWKEPTPWVQYFQRSKFELTQAIKSRLIQSEVLCLETKSRLHEDLATRLIDSKDPSRLKGIRADSKIVFRYPMASSRTCFWMPKSAPTV